MGMLCGDKNVCDVCECLERVRMFDSGDSRTTSWSTPSVTTHRGTVVTATVSTVTVVLLMLSLLSPRFTVLTATVTTSPRSLVPCDRCSRHCHHGPTAITATARDEVFFVSLFGRLPKNRTRTPTTDCSVLFAKKWSWLISSVHIEFWLQKRQLLDHKAPNSTKTPYFHTSTKRKTPCKTRWFSSSKER